MTVPDSSFDEAITLQDAVDGVLTRELLELLERAWMLDVGDKAEKLAFFLRCVRATERHAERAHVLREVRGLMESDNFRFTLHGFTLDAFFNRLRATADHEGVEG